MPLSFLFCWSLLDSRGKSESINTSLVLSEHMVLFSFSFLAQIGGRCSSSPKRWISPDKGKDNGLLTKTWSSRVVSLKESTWVTVVLHLWWLGAQDGYKTGAILWWGKKKLGGGSQNHGSRKRSDMGGGSHSGLHYAMESQPGAKEPRQFRVRWQEAL